jgi:hypothetical protein
VGPTELESVTSTVSRWRSSLSMLFFLQIGPIFACGKCVSHRLSQRYRNVARFQLLSQNRLAGEPGDTGSQVPYGRAPPGPPRRSAFGRRGSLWLCQTQLWSFRTQSLASRQAVESRRHRVPVRVQYSVTLQPLSSRGLSVQRTRTANAREVRCGAVVHGIPDGVNT